jgi:hypothetical protein
MAECDRYNIVRHFRKSGRRKIVHRGVSLEVAQLHKAELTFKKPYCCGISETAFAYREKIEALKKRGYDGMISGTEFVVFSPGQVRVVQ